MTFAVVGLTCSSLTVRLDMAGPSFEFDTGLYARNRVSVTALQVINLMPAAHRGHKNASRAAPARCLARGYDAGISTVSTTWMTPFDWLTLEIVTIEVPPLASTIQILPS